MRSWWNTNQDIIMYVLETIGRGFELVGEILAGLFRLALVMFVVTYFVPEIRNEMPVLCEFLNMIISLMEWMFKTAFGGLDAILHGEILQHSGSISKEVSEGWKILSEFIRNCR